MEEDGTTYYLHGVVPGGTASPSIWHAFLEGGGLAKQLYKLFRNPTAVELNTLEHGTPDEPLDWVEGLPPEG